MKKIKIIKLTSGIIFIISGIFLMLMTVLFHLEVKAGAYIDPHSIKPADALVDMACDNIARNYSARLLNEYIKGGRDESVLKQYENSNMIYAVIKTSGNNNYDSKYRTVLYKKDEFNYDYDELRGIFHGYGIGGYSYNTSSLYSAIYSQAIAYNGYDSAEGRINYWVVYKIDKSFRENDLFYRSHQLIYQFEFIINHVLILLIISAVITVISFIISLIFAGIKHEEHQYQLTLIDKIPFLSLTGIYAITFYLFIDIVKQKLDYKVASYLGVVSRGFMLAAVAVLIELMTLVYAKSIVVRINTEKFWSNTELYYVKMPFRLLYEKAKENMSVFARTLMIIGATAFLEILTVIAVAYSGTGTFLGMAGIVVLTILKIAQIGLIVYIVLEYFYINKVTESIAQGNLNSKPDIKKLWFLKKHAQNINELADGMQVAVLEQVKSEHLKTELITNVSHDIKTPLTSIINYVDLIKREDAKRPINNENIKEYIAILDRQSGRLKKLIEDLIEASKASTGNIDVNIEKCDLSVLLAQTVGEFTDKAENHGLNIVMRNKASIIMADGRLLWRVLGNILDNACKYSLEGTRIYIDVEEKMAETPNTENTDQNEEIQLIFKNISKEPLNISSDELMERFVRGDSSRNTEGSGLGLSISLSLMQLMGGSMNIDIDGDMFKVILGLKRANASKINMSEAYGTTVNT